jgi:hypothetical protein
MIPVSLILKPKHLIKAGSRIDPSKCAIANLFNELPGVNKTLVSQTFILLYGIEKYRLETPDGLIRAEKNLYEETTFQSYSLIVFLPEWVDPDGKIMEDIPLKPLTTVFKQWWKKINEVRK